MAHPTEVTMIDVLLLSVFVSGRGIRSSGTRSSGRRVGTRPLRDKPFVPGKLRRRQVHPSLDALFTYFSLPPPKPVFGTKTICMVSMREPALTNTIWLQDTG
jgi:hypothetical protein